MVGRCFWLKAVVMALLPAPPVMPDGGQSKLRALFLGPGRHDNTGPNWALVLVEPLGQVLSRCSPGQPATLQAYVPCLASKQPLLGASTYLIGPPAAELLPHHSRLCVGIRTSSSVTTLRRPTARQTSWCQRSHGDRFGGWLSLRVVCPI